MSLLTCALHDQTGLTRSTATALHCTPKSIELMWMLLLSAQMLSPEPHTVIGTMACRNVLYLEKCQQS